MELADSIRQHGVIQPLLVRPLDNGMYQLVAGERRWRASRMAGLMEVPVVIRDLSDHEAMEIALIENLQRKDLNVIEEALGYRKLMDDFSLTQDEISQNMNLPYVGTRRRVLVDSVAKRGEGVYAARTATNKLVHFETNECPVGKLVNVKIERAGAFDLFAKIITKDGF